MIVLDTNVLSELLRPAPDERVVAWVGRQSRAALFTTALTRGEILYGVRLLPVGRGATVSPRRFAQCLTRTSPGVFSASIGMLQMPTLRS
ncbi:PIN domain-containing protein [Paraburkholderia aromaticivorans]|uniref:PIN domain-containing protein n=1 Tax=Paraburkholderia aromaticivorans TaxID=2026199 RepID=UPI00321738D1